MRKIGILLVVLLMCMGGAAQAQEMAPVVCGGLAEADCEILRQSQQAMASLNSATFDLAMSLEMTNIPDVPGPLTLGLAGTGAFSGDMSAFYQMPPADLMTDSKAYGEYVSNLLNSFQGQLDLILTLPPDVVAQSQGQVPETLPLNLRLVDGVGYIDFDAIANAVGGDAGLPEGWGGLDIGQLIAVSLTQSMGMTNMGGMDPMMFQQFNNPEFAEQYVTVTRLDDAVSTTGVPVAVFAMTFDFAGMMSDPAVQDLMQQSMQAQMDAMGDQGMEMTEEDMAMMSDMMSQMFEDFNLSMTQAIGLEDFYVYSTTTSFTWDMSGMMNATMGAMGDTEASEFTQEDFTATEEAPLTDGEMAGMPEQWPTINFEMVVDYDSFNLAPEITAPENVTMFPLDMMGMGDGTGMDDTGMGDTDMMATEEMMGAEEMEPMATEAAAG